MTDEYAYNGFRIVASGVPEATLDAARKAKGPSQPEGYRYNKAGNRIFEAWKTSQAVRDIVFAPAVLAAIREEYDLESEPRALQTINFDRGTNQPLHQDGIHFQTQPLGRMVGAWTALEDMDEDNGPLVYVPGSHREGFLGWQDLGFHQVPVGTQFSQYYEYEKRIKARAPAALGSLWTFTCKKGDTLIWGLDLFHGGAPIKDPTRTRHSQVTHYAFADAEFGWAPMFSNPASGDYLKKSMRWFDREGRQHSW